MRKTGLLTSVSLAGGLGFYGLVLGGCVRAPPVVMTLQAPTIQVHGEPEMTKEGLTIGIAVIGPDNERNFPLVYKRVSWTGHEKNPFTDQLIAVERTGTTSLVPSPGFQVRIANHTGHVIKFTTAVFRLQDNSGQTYPLSAGTAELIALQETLWDRNVGPDAKAGVMPQLSGAIGSLQLLNRNTELLNGDEWTGYLVFNMSVLSQGDYDALLARVERFTLRMAEVPIDVDQAGVVKKTTEFTFTLDKTVKSMRVTCPAETKTPALGVCSPEV